MMIFSLSEKGKILAIKIKEKNCRFTKRFRLFMKLRIQFNIKYLKIEDVRYIND